MDQAIALKAGGEFGEIDILFQVDADVIRFAPVDGHEMASFWWLLKEISAYLFRAFDVIGVESALHL